MILLRQVSRQAWQPLEREGGGRERESCAGNAQAPCWLVEGDYTEMREESVGGGPGAAHVPMRVLRAEMREEEEAVLFTTNATQPPCRAWGSRHRTSNAAHPAPRGKKKKQRPKEAVVMLMYSSEKYTPKLRSRRRETPLKKMSPLDGKTKTKR